MPAYVIFHRQSGQIVHVHIEPDEVAMPREGLLAMVDPSHSREALDIVVADLATLRAGIASHVDPQTRKVKPAEKEGFGFVGGWLGSNVPQRLPSGVRRVYTRLGRGTP